MAYRRHGGRLHKAYMGKAEDLTLEKLHDAAAALGKSEASNSQTPAAAAAAKPGRVDPPDARAGERAPNRSLGDPLLSTKLSIPPARPYLVRRPRLSELLRNGMGCRLTLVSAPAGLGKTTLLGAWFSEPSGGPSAAWLSLDAADNDPARFWRYFVTAVDRLRPGLGEVALASLGKLKAFMFAFGNAELEFQLRAVLIYGLCLQNLQHVAAGVQELVSLSH